MVATWRLHRGLDSAQPPHGRNYHFVMLPTIRFGTAPPSADELAISRLGLGCMGMSKSYGPADEDESIRTLHDALDRGVNHFDTADVYGNGHNELLLSKVVVKRRDETYLATKFGITRDPARPAELTMRGTPDYVRASCEASLKRLGVEYIDLLYQHRVDLAVPIEETVGAMSDLVLEGKIRHIGLSEASAANIRRAHAVHPIAAVQSEWSLWSRDIEEEVVPTCRELGIVVVAYAPLGRGFLTGELAPGSLGDGDSRRRQPRFQGDNLNRNLGLLSALKRIAAERGFTLAQLSLAWVAGRGQDVAPIPGSTRRAHLRENIEAMSVDLTLEELAEIGAALPVDQVSGDRYADMSFVHR